MIQIILVLIGLLCTLAARYDQRVCLFSPDGRLLQAEYANAAAEKGELVACVITSEGDFVVITPSRKLENFVDKRSVDKLSKLDDGLWMVFSGLAGDGRLIVQTGRSFCVNYRTQFGCTPNVAAVAKSIGSIQHRSTLNADARPLGINTAIFGYDDSDEPKIFVTRATGHVTQWHAFALGKNADKLLELMEYDFNIDKPRNTRDSVDKLMQLVAQIAHYEDDDNDDNESTSTSVLYNKDNTNISNMNKKMDVYVVSRRNMKDLEREEEEEQEEEQENKKEKPSRKIVSRFRIPTLFYPGAKSFKDLPKEWWKEEEK
jgi:20S proteasome subunit alpha 4